MDGLYYRLILEKQKYIKDNREMLIAGMLMVLAAYYAVTRPSFPGQENFTWGYLLTIYGVCFYVGASFWAAWKLLHKFTSQQFLFLPLIGWIIYLFIKVSLALIIGTYLYGVVRFINNIYQIQILNNKMKQI